jgi:Flp pilus assembly protein TadG
MRQRGAALAEFAVAWPVCLLVVLGTVQVGLWAEEAAGVRTAAAAGARVAAAPGVDSAAATATALAILRPSLFGVRPAAWCPGSAGLAPRVWVCATTTMAAVEVRVGGSVPALVPLVPGGRGLPVAADAKLARERFR